MQRALAILAATVGLTGSAVVATTSPAAADVPCVITGFTPTSVVVGLVPVSRRFDVSTAACEESGWEVLIANRQYSAFSDSPFETFRPRRDADAGPKQVVVTTANGDLLESSRTFDDGFSLKRRTAFRVGTFNASPEPARAGRSINIKGRLVVADWDRGRYVGARGRSVQVQFATPSGQYLPVKTLKADRTGWVRTKVTARFTGVWRLVYAGNSTAGGAKTHGDAVVLR